MVENDSRKLRKLIEVPESILFYASKFEFELGIFWENEFLNKLVNLEPLTFESSLTDVICRSYSGHLERHSDLKNRNLKWVKTTDLTTEAIEWSVGEVATSSLEGLFGDFSPLNTSSVVSCFAIMTHKVVHHFPALSTNTALRRKLEGVLSSDNKWVLNLKHCSFDRELL